MIPTLPTKGPLDDQSRLARSHGEVVEDGHDRSAKKLGLRAFVALLFFLTAALVLVISSSLLASLSRSEETEAVFTEAAELRSELFEAVVWRADPSGLPREMEPLTRVDVTNSWLRAWEQFRIVAQTGETTGVEVYFSGPALESVMETAAAWDGRSVKQQSHLLQLTFYSEDGQVIGLTSTASDLLRTEEVDGQLWTQHSVEQFEAVLVLEDGNWRIHHLVRRAVNAGPWVEATSPRE